MNELVCTDLWPTIKKLAHKSRVKRAAVAYVTSEEFVRFGDGDVLVTDASDEAIKTGQTSARLLAAAYKRGAQLYSLPNLHAKVFVLGGAAVIGSANLSYHSPKHLVEAAWVTDTPTAIGMAAGFVQQLAEQATVIDEAFIKRVGAIKVLTGPKPFVGAKTLTKVAIHKPSVWVVGMHSGEDDPTLGEAIEEATAEAAQVVTHPSSGVYHFNWNDRRTGRSAPQKWDSVIAIWSPRHDKPPEAVYQCAPILLRRDEPTDTLLFVEEYADSEKTRIPWSRFRQLAKQVGLPGTVTADYCRRIPERRANALAELMKE